MKKVFLLAALATAATGAFASPSTYTQAIDAARPLFEKGDYVGAQKLTEEALSLAKTPDEKVGALTRLGRTYNERKLYPQAREQWARVFQLPDASAKDKFAMRVAIATSYGEEKDYGRAIADFQKLIDAPEATPEDKFSLRLSLGGAFVGNKNYAEARKQFSALANDPALPADAHSLALTFLASTFVDTRDFDQARAVYTQILNLPDAPRLLRLEALQGIASTYQSQGDTVQAQKALVKVRDEALRLSDVSYDQKDFASAIVFKAQALATGTLAPSRDAGMHVQIGELLLLDGKFAQARDYENTFLKKQYPADISEKERPLVLGSQQAAQITIARSYAQEGNKAQAQQVLQSLLARENLNPSVRVEASDGLKALS